MKGRNQEMLLLKWNAANCVFQRLIIKQLFCGNRSYDEDNSIKFSILRK